MNSKKIIISFWALAACINVYAQRDTVIKGATIEIIQLYKPEVKPAPRPELTPALPPLDTTRPVLSYTVPQQTLSYTYNALPLRPLALNLDSGETAFSNYVKFGGGNLSTIYVDAGLSALKGDNYETAVSINHLSQSGNINNQKVSLTGADISGRYYSTEKIFNAGLNVQHSRYHYYGYNHEVYTYPATDVRQAYTDISLQLDMADRNTADKQFSYAPSVTGGVFNASQNAGETWFNLSVPLQYSLDANTMLYLALNGQFANYSADSPGVNISQANNVLQATPGIRFSREAFSGHAGIALTSGNIAGFYLLPDIEAEFTIPGTQFMLHAGWKGGLVQNTYRQLATLNPYMSPVYNIRQTSSTEVFAGIKSNIGDNISFNGRVSWREYSELPVFINDTATDGKQFFVVYDSKVNALSLQAGIRYQVAEVFALGFNGQWFNFYSSTLPRLWHTPGVKFTGDFRLVAAKKLAVTGYVSFIDELYALEKGNRTVKLSSILDIGGGAEYETIPRLNIFLQVNNLLNSQYQRWYGYDAFGFNIFGGLRVKF